MMPVCPDSWLCGLLVLAAAALVTPLAHAQQPSDDQGAVSNDPWADGVSAQQQTRARSLYDRANELFEESDLQRAVETYREALQHWDHPMIRYNLAVVLTELEQPVPAYKHIEAALRYGAEPFQDSRAYKRALKDRRALQARLVALTIRCDAPGVEINLNSDTVLTEPGVEERLIVPGDFQLIVRSRDSATLLQKVSLFGDRRYRVTIDPRRAVVRRWSRWLPWSVLGAGV
ncbi:MAG: hypothetical protein AAGC55_25000, partial [Myxococcota bacterium]